MAELHDALTYLKPITWADIPSSSSSTVDLHEYTSEILNKARLIVETVPEQNPSSASLSDVGASAASIIKLNPPGLLSQSQLDSLRKEWGKPIKMNNAKENPLNIPVYKLGGKDGKGAWFARRSVHKGLPYSRWKGKMQVEMEESLKVRQEEVKQGRTPEYCIRGIGGDRKLERIDVRQCEKNDEEEDDNDNDNESLATLEVYQQSAQFPGPTTPRDFVTMLITSDSISSDGADSDPPLPPTYIIVSKPCKHPDAPPRNDYIRGEYESVELIRELPIQKSAASNNTTSSNGDAEKTANGETEDVTDAPNPVEWIMITRSDPGGSVPKWMVERGTPKSITGDAVKFLNWASKPDLAGEEEAIADIAEMTESVENSGRFSSTEGTIVADQQPDAVETGDKGAELLNQQSSKESDTVEDCGGDGDDEQQEDSNLWSNVAKMVQDYTPRAVFNYIPGRLSPSLSLDKEESPNTTIPMKETKSGLDEGETDDEPGKETKEQKTDGIDEGNDTSSLTSDDSFTSADSHVPSSSTAGVSAPPVYGQDYYSSQSASAMNSKAALGTPGLSDVAADAAAAITRKKPSSREKELAKLNARKREVEVNLASTRSQIRELGGPASKGGNSNSTKTDIDSAHGSTNSGESSSNSNKNEASINTSTSTIAATTQVAMAAQTQKRVDQLLRTESKLISRLNKIEAQQLKVSKKLEADQRKAAGREEKTRSRSEIESLRKEIASLRQEVLELRGEREKWISIVGTMQKENAMLVSQARKGSGKEGGYGTD